MSSSNKKIGGHAVNTGSAGSYDKQIPDVAAADRFLAGISPSSSNTWREQME